MTIVKPLICYDGVFKDLADSDTVEHPEAWNYIINGGMQTAQCIDSSYSLSTTRQYAQADMWLVRAYGTTPSAGTISRSESYNAGTTGYEIAVEGVTFPDDGTLSFEHRIPSKYSRSLYYQPWMVCCSFYHNAGIDITGSVKIKTADSIDDFSVTNYLWYGSDITVPTATKTNVYLPPAGIFYTQDTEIQKGLNIEFSFDVPQAITSKDFYFGDAYFVRAEKFLPYYPICNDYLRCLEFFWRQIPLSAGTYSIYGYGKPASTSSAGCVFLTPVPLWKMPSVLMVGDFRLNTPDGNVSLDESLTAITSIVSAGKNQFYLTVYPESGSSFTVSSGISWVQALNDSDAYIDWDSRP